MKRKLKLLIVEDDIANSTLLSEYFRHLGIDSYSADNGVSAIEFVESNPDTDLVLMDLKLPLLNGIESTKRIKEICPDCVVVAQTAYANPESKIRVVEAGAEAFFTKPLDLNEIYDYIVMRFSV